MPTPDIDTALGWRGRTVLARDGERLGKLGAIYLDEDGRPAFGGVRTGLFGHRESVIPLHEAQPDGDDVRVPYAKDDVEAAPNVDPDVELTRDEESELLEHFGAAEQTRDREEGMVRSEEEVDVSAGPMRATERVRLRKVLVTDHVEKTVPVRREEVRLETDPPPEGTIERVEDAEPER